MSAAPGRSPAGSYRRPQGDGDPMRPVVIVTGAADGIGWATAQCLAQQSWCVALLDLRGEAARARAAELGSGHLGLGCDVSDAASVQTAVSAVQAHLGRVDGLVNNAGIGDQTVPTLQQTVEGFDRVLAVHLRGQFLMSQAVASVLLAQPARALGQRGAIVNLASIAALGGIPARNAYCAAKAGVVGMTQAMAMEWARQGVRVNAVAPGYVATALVAGLAFRGALDGAAIERRTPLGRMGEPREIAQAIAFLLSPAASYITGVVLPVDGGWSSLGASEASLG